MTGQEHYAEAERLIDSIDSGTRPAADVAAVAQVHATLAQVAATIYAVPGSTPSWDAALS